jgi:hypothetical protein
VSSQGRRTRNLETSPEQRGPADVRRRSRDRRSRSSSSTVTASLTWTGSPNGGPSRSSCSMSSSSVRRCGIWVGNAGRADNPGEQFPGTRHAAVWDAIHPVVFLFDSGDRQLRNEFICSRTWSSLRKWIDLGNLIATISNHDLAFQRPWHHEIARADDPDITS